jgi:hypothetical protein
MIDPTLWIYFGVFISAFIAYVVIVCRYPKKEK